MFVGGTYRPEGRRQRLFTRPRRRSGRGWMVFAIFVVFVGFAWLWAFQRGPDAAGVPVIKADNQPTRKKPDNPGGLRVVDIDPLGERAAPNVEKLAPPPESPLPRPQADGGNAANTNEPPPPLTPIQVAADGAVGPPVQLVKPSPSASPAPAPAPVAAKPAPAPAPVAVVTPQPAAPAPSPAPPAAAAEVPKPAALAPGEKAYRLQLASVRSEAAAKDTWAILKKSHSDILGAMNFSVMEADLGDRGTYYRIMIGPMSQAAATQTCDALKRQGAACLLAKP